MSRVSVFGLGYVGVVTASCLAKDGHQVIGVDLNATKVDLVNAGKSPIVEQDTPGLIQEAVERGLLGATRDAAKPTMTALSPASTTSMTMTWRSAAALSCSHSIMLGAGRP